MYNQDFKKIKILKNSNNSFERCKALCQIGESFYVSMTDAMLFFISSKEKVIKNIFHCFNEIFKYHASLNFYSEAGLTFYLSNEIDDKLIKEWIDKAGHEVVFFDLASTGQYEDYEVVVVDYQIEEYQFIGYESPAMVFNIILGACKVLNENDEFFNDFNEEINNIIDTFWGEIEYEY